MNIRYQSMFACATLSLLACSWGCQSSIEPPSESPTAKSSSKQEALLAKTELPVEQSAVAEGNSPVTPEAGPQAHTVAKPVVPAAPGIPPVLLSAEHHALCRVNVGDAFPQFELPLDTGEASTLSTQRGERATVVLFWATDRWMARAALADLSRDVFSQFGDRGVSLLGVAVGQPQEEVQTVSEEAGVSFQQFLDADAKLLKQVGGWALPRVYVLDGDGKIAWFDIEYSEATRRELRQTLDELTSGI